jgi:OOP family OmpA-OmpF porin
VVLDDKQQVCQNRFTDEMGNKTILFTTAKAIIRAQSYPVLDVLANIARDCADVLGDRHIEIGGHTDSDGSDSYNQLLSEQRAAAVKQYLVKKGVNTALLTVKGYGESRPVADNLSVEGRAQNRRIEFKLK